jgi:hypothetical protein
MPGTGSAFTAFTDVVPILSTGTAPEAGPLTSSPPSRGQGWGGSPVESCLQTLEMVKPVRHTLSTLYSTCIYINQLSSVIKPVLLYLLLCLLPHIIFLLLILLMLFIVVVY